jgi:alanine racemase
MPNSGPLAYVEISKANLIHNIKQFRRLIDVHTKISAVVKANAFGHGDLEVVKILNPYVDYFQVNSIEELARVRTISRKPVLVLGYIQKSELKRAIELGCIISIFDIEHAKALNVVAQKLDKKVKVHIAIDSHLGREGIMPIDLPNFLIEFKKLKNIICDGVYSHFANIEDTTDFSHGQKQIDTFKSVVEQFKNAGYKNIKNHISATSGILAYEKWKGIHDIARIGVGLYGMWPSVELEKIWKKKITLKPVLRYVTHVAQVKNLPKGHTVGYGLTYVAKSDIKIAVIPQGYADGLTRTLSNNGEVLIRGMRAPILGRVAMNMFVVNVTDIKGVKTEDEVVILGAQKGLPAARQGEVITAEEIARNMGTINYEVTTHLSPFLPRIVR